VLGKKWVILIIRYWLPEDYALQSALRIYSRPYTKGPSMRLKELEKEGFIECAEEMR
jgi:DNA-binding HxlR family transcriptional regulator